MGIVWENTTPSTDLPRDFCAGIGPLQLGVVLVYYYYLQTHYKNNTHTFVGGVWSECIWRVDMICSVSQVDRRNLVGTFMFYMDEWSLSIFSVSFWHRCIWVFFCSGIVFAVFAFSIEYIYTKESKMEIQICENTGFKNAENKISGWSLIMLKLILLQILCWNFADIE